MKLRDKVKAILITIGSIAAIIFLFLFNRNKFYEKKNEEIHQKAIENKKEADKLKEEVDKIKEATASEEKQMNEMMKSAESLNERLKKLSVMTLMVFVLISFVTIPVFAADVPQPNIPKDYDTLVKNYKELWSIAFEYKGLYEKASALNIQLLNEKTELLGKFDALYKQYNDLYSLNNDLYELNKKILTSGHLKLALGVETKPFDYKESDFYLEIQLSLL
jgi:uncharacterized coiled-coil DUF342 family protein